MSDDRPDEYTPFRRYVDPKREPGERLWTVLKDTVTHIAGCRSRGRLPMDMPHIVVRSLADSPNLSFGSEVCTCRGNHYAARSVVGLIRRSRSWSQGRCEYSVAGSTSVIAVQRKPSKSWIRLLATCRLASGYPFSAGP